VPRELRLLILSCPLFLVWTITGAEERVGLPVWPGAVAGDYGKTGPERVRAPSEAPTKDAKWITNVTKPRLSRPEAASTMIRRLRR